MLCALAEEGRACYLGDMGLIPFLQEAGLYTLPYAIKADDIGGAHVDAATINAQWAGLRFPVSEEDSSQLDISPTTESAPDSFRSHTTSLFDTPLSSQAPSLRGDTDRCFDLLDISRHSQQQQKLLLLQHSRQGSTDLNDVNLIPHLRANSRQACAYANECSEPLQLRFTRASLTMYHMSTAVAPLYTLQKDRHGILTISRSQSFQNSFSSTEVFKIDSDNIQREQWAKHIRITDVVPKTPSYPPTSLGTRVLKGVQGFDNEQASHATKRDCFRVAKRRGCRHYDIYHRELSGYLPTSSELAVKCRTFSYEIDVPHLRVSVSPAAIVVRKSLNTSHSPVPGSTTYDASPLLMFDLKESALSVNIDGIMSTFSTPCATDALVACVLIIAIVDPDTRGVLSQMPHPECHCEIAPATAALPHVVVPPGSGDCPITSVSRALKSLGITQRSTERNKLPVDDTVMSMDPPVSTSPPPQSCHEDSELADTTAEQPVLYSPEKQPIDCPATIIHCSDTKTESTKQSQTECRKMRCWSQRDETCDKQITISVGSRCRMDSFSSTSDSLKQVLKRRFKWFTRRAS